MTIFRERDTGQHWEAVIIKYLLLERGIEAFIQREKDTSKEVLDQYLGLWDKMKVVVSNLDFEKAKVIVTEYEKKAQKDISGL